MKAQKVLDLLNVIRPATGKRDIRWHKYDRYEKPDFEGDCFVAWADSIELKLFVTEEAVALQVVDGLDQFRSLILTTNCSQIAGREVRERNSRILMEELKDSVPSSASLVGTPPLRVSERIRKALG